MTFLILAYLKACLAASSLATVGCWRLSPDLRSIAIPGGAVLILCGAIQGIAA